MVNYLTIVNDDFSESIVKEPESEYGFTYADYLSWTFKERVELIKGKIFKMSPAPLITHQKIVANINNYFARKVDGFPCNVLFSPVDVKLIGKPFRRKVKDDEIFTVVQPDLIVVCDEEKLQDPRSINGAPEMVVEVLSPGNTKTETKHKFKLYEENGVLEYWVVHPPYKYVEVFILKNNLFGSATIYEMGDIINCSVLKGITIPVIEIFK